MLHLQLDHSDLKYSVLQKDLSDCCASNSTYSVVVVVVVVAVVVVDVVVLVDTAALKRCVDDHFVLVETDGWIDGQSSVSECLSLELVTMVRPILPTLLVVSCDHSNRYDGCYVAVEVDSEGLLAMPLLVLEVLGQMRPPTPDH